MNRKWTQEEAVKLCRHLEEIAPHFGGHVALTGGCLYKEGERKDLDILIYRSMDEDPFDWDGFFERIATIGIDKKEDFGFCKKAWYVNGDGSVRHIDFLDPMAPNDYNNVDDEITFDDV